MKVPVSQEGITALQKLAADIDTCITSIRAAASQLENDTPSEGLGEYEDDVKKILAVIQDTQSTANTQAYILQAKLHEQANQIKDIIDILNGV